ncbi:MAG: winged helix-turn-helix domain-containing protein [Patescibacteria group bacterium]|nr:winged helix-turn-helix domain-containing protein [Patescibacteria group bacterium]
MLEQLFSSRTRVKLIKLFMLNEEESYFIREISRKIKEHINSVRRELNNLESVDLINSSGQGQKKYYQVNSEHVIFPELKSMVFKSQIFMEKSFIKKIQKSGRIKLLILTGFFAGQENNITDILIVGSINRKKLKSLVKKFQKKIDHPLHYTIMTNKEFEYRNNLTDKFLFNILEGKKIVLVDKIDAS